jgi:hypothetical protein
MFNVVVLFFGSTLLVAGLCGMVLMLLAGDPADYIHAQYTKETLKRKERHGRLVGYAFICAWIMFGAAFVLIPTVIILAPKQ